MHLIHINIKKVFNPNLACTRGSDTTVGTEGIQIDVQRKNKILIPPGIYVQGSNPGGKVNKTYLFLLTEEIKILNLLIYPLP